MMLVTKWDEIVRRTERAMIGEMSYVSLVEIKGVWLTLTQMSAFYVVLVNVGESKLCVSVGHVVRS